MFTDFTVAYHKSGDDWFGKEKWQKRAKHCTRETPQASSEQMKLSLVFAGISCEAG
jgi:hypothetical protein